MASGKHAVGRYIFASLLLTGFGAFDARAQDHWIGPPEVTITPTVFFQPGETDSVHVLVRQNAGMVCAYNTTASVMATPHHPLQDFLVTLRSEIHPAAVSQGSWECPAIQNDEEHRATLTQLAEGKYRVVFDTTGDYHAELGDTAMFEVVRSSGEAITASSWDNFELSLSAVQALPTDTIRFNVQQGGVHVCNVQMSTTIIPTPDSPWQDFLVVAVNHVSGPCLTVPGYSNYTVTLEDLDPGTYRVVFDTSGTYYRHVGNASRFEIVSEPSSIRGRPAALLRQGAARYGSVDALGRRQPDQDGVRVPPGLLRSRVNDATR